MFTFGLFLTNNLADFIKKELWRFLEDDAPLALKYVKSL